MLENARNVKNKTKIRREKKESWENFYQEFFYYKDHVFDAKKFEN